MTQKYRLRPDPCSDERPASQKVQAPAGSMTSQAIVCDSHGLGNSRPTQNMTATAPPAMRAATRP